MKLICIKKKGSQCKNSQNSNKYKKKANMEMVLLNSEYEVCLTDFKKVLCKYVKIICIWPISYVIYCVLRKGGNIIIYILKCNSMVLNNTYLKLKYFSVREVLKNIGLFKQQCIGAQYFL